MADGGWVAVQRKIQKSFVWANPFVLKLWLLCLFKASHDGNRFLFNGEEIQVDRGQFVTGRVALAKDYNVGARGEHQLSPTSINRWMNKFRELGMVDISATARYSVVTVINYDLYQSSGQLADTSRTSSGHLADTINNANNANNANKRDSQHPRKREYADGSPELIEATYLWEKIKSNNPEHRKPNLQPWANDIRKMHEIDKRPFDKIHRMIDW
uniref:replication protein n=1 Tax=Lacticaseibacillus mingshuiensis TaxID=2799574 RepID=UPI001951068B